MRISDCRSDFCSSDLGEGGAKRRVRVRRFAAPGAGTRCSYPCAVTPTIFPIDALLPQVRESLIAHPRLVLEAPPGAGKTTQVPPALLDAPWLASRTIVTLRSEEHTSGLQSHML